MSATAGRQGPMSRGTFTVSVVGVGGQGVLRAAAVLAFAAVSAGLQVKSSEIKGMSQRGGSVLSTVRFGPQVFSPVSATADLVIATELLEGLRGLSLLEPGGTIVCAGSTRIPPGAVLRREQPYPGGLAEAAAARGVNLLEIDAEALAREAGNLRTVNSVLLGAASGLLPFSDDDWRRGLAAAVPAKTLEANLRALRLGREATTSQEALL
ncbi:MAG: indolepyruvate oxidoreductase subunit beta [Bifidobacteriaceae bacterium]|jgi:indolepyruvate ferredoxin oxidoreductase beta subunit|nr:indolepyruvate oxidoreductase subunit beta [Bifidobacteriaceae bacterium]